jgi:putative transposase
VQHLDGFLRNEASIQRLKRAVTLANGKKLEAPKALTVNLRKLRRRSRRHSRKQKSSANRRKSARRLAKFHARIANVREN